jgi:hypothetical protein
MASENSSDRVEEAQPDPPPPRRKRRVFLRIALGIVIVAIAWVLISPGPFAGAIRNLAGDRPDQPVLDNSFSISPHGFRYYKFSLAAGSKDVWLIGQFNSVAENDKAASRSELPSGEMQGAENETELLVLADSAFPTWQKGNSSTPVYDSGKVSHKNLESRLPDGPGTYYVVFSNKMSAVNAKKIKARLWLHYKSWLPEWLRHKNRQEK